MGFGDIWTLFFEYEGSWGTQIASSEDGNFLYKSDTDFGIVSISDDHGVTWEDVLTHGTVTGIKCSETGQYAIVRCIIRNPAIQKFYTTNNYGVSWTEHSLPDNQCLSIECNISGDGKYVAIIYQKVSIRYILLSSDYGVIFSQLSNLLFLNASAFYYICFSYTGQFILVSAAGTLSTSYLYISSDYGVSWLQKNGVYAQIADAICMSDSGQYMYAAYGFDYLYKSSNYGITWAQKRALTNVNCLMICNNTGDKLLLNTDYFDDENGINIATLDVSIDFGETWQNKIPSEQNYTTYIGMSNDASLSFFERTVDPSTLPPYKLSTYKSIFLDIVTMNININVTLPDFQVHFSPPELCHLYQNPNNWYFNLKDLLITQFKKGNIKDISDIMERKADSLYTVYVQLKRDRFLETSYGIQLDNIGTIFDLLRNSGESDTNYRLRLKFKRDSLKYSGQFNDILYAIKFFTGDSVHTSLIEVYPAMLIGQTNTVITQFLYNSIKSIISAGVSLNLSFHVGVPLVFLNDDMSTPAYGKGFSEFNGSIIDYGGEISELFN